MRRVSPSDLESNPEDFMVTATWCAPCKNIKKAFAHLDFAYIEADIDEDYVTQFFKNNKLEIMHFPTLVTYGNKFEISTTPVVAYLKLLDLQRLREDQVEYTDVK